MNRSKEMIEELLKCLSHIESGSFQDPSSLMPALPAVFSAPAKQKEKQKQFFSWIERVTSSLKAASMNEELRIWSESVDSGVPASTLEPSLSAQIASLKSILLGFLGRLEQVGPLEPIFPMELVEGTRDYIEKAAEQANGCYKHGWYDACAVMLRRLIETLIIECFEHHNVAQKIKNSDGNYFYLRELIQAFLVETDWHIPRNMRKNLDKLKTIGDSSAHDRYFVATRSDIEGVSDAIRFTIQALVFIAKLNDTERR